MGASDVQVGLSEMQGQALFCKLMFGEIKFSGSRPGVGLSGMPGPAFVRTPALQCVVIPSIQVKRADLGNTGPCV